MNGNHILNEGESKGEHKVEQVLKERLAHRLILGGREYGPLLASSSQLFLSQKNSLIERLRVTFTANGKRQIQVENFSVRIKSKQIKSVQNNFYG